MANKDQMMRSHEYDIGLNSLESTAEGIDGGKEGYKGRSGEGVEEAS